MTFVPLHNPVLVKVAQVNATATRAFNPPGEAVSGFNDVLRQPAYYVDGSGARMSAVQTTDVFFLAQIEMDRERFKRMVEGGDMPLFNLALVAHIRDLERRSLMNADGTCKVRVGDRIVQLLNPRRTTHVLDTFTGPESLWIEEARSGSWGFSGLRDLFIFFCVKKEEPG